MKTRLFSIAREALANDENIVQRLLEIEGVDRRVAIEIAYALQSGSYTAYAETKTARDTRLEGHAILEPALANAGCRTLLDCGAGEATRWLDFTTPLDNITFLDASWQRLRYAQKNFEKIESVNAARFVKADMNALPFMPNSFDAVFTSHAVEPNTDAHAENIIANMFQVARRIVVLFEPNYRDAEQPMRERMEHAWLRQEYLGRST